MQDVSLDMLGGGVFCGWRWFSAFSKSPEIDRVNLVTLLAFQLPLLWVCEIHVFHLELLAIHAVPGGFGG